MLAGGDRLDVGLQRSRSPRADPSGRLSAVGPVAPRASSPRHQAGVRLAVFLHAHGLLRDAAAGRRSSSSTSRQVLGSGTRMVGSMPSSLSTAIGLGPRAIVVTSETAARNRSRSTCRSISASKCRMPTPVMKMMMSICPVITRLAKSTASGFSLNRHFAHRGADERHAPQSLDQPGHVGGAPTLERRPRADRQILGTGPCHPS